MCADPKMMRLLAAELREAYAARRGLSRPGGRAIQWKLAASAATVALAVFIAL